MDAAFASLNRLSKADFVEIRSLRNPPRLVILAAEAMCIMFDLKFQPHDVFKVAHRRLLTNPGYTLSNMQHYDRDNIPEATVARIEAFLRRHAEDFTPQNAAKVSKWAAACCEWVRAMVEYHHKALVVAPMRQALQTAHNRHSASMTVLTHLAEQVLSAGLELS